jgi:Flp pilus assembly pilin Flp
MGSPECVGISEPNQVKEGNSMLNLVKKFVREDDGLEMVEWAIVAALITTAAAVTMASIGSQVNTQFGTVLTTLQNG